MIPKRRIESVLANIPQMEIDSMTNKQRIREFLFETEEPLKASEIANALKINPNTVRRDCRELLLMGHISQPGRTDLLMGNLLENGKSMTTMLNPSVTAYTCTKKDMEKYVETMLTTRA